MSGYPKFKSPSPALAGSGLDRGKAIIKVPSAAINPAMGPAIPISNKAARVRIGVDDQLGVDVRPEDGDVDLAILQELGLDGRLAAEVALLIDKNGVLLVVKVGHVDPRLLVHWPPRLDDVATIAANPDPRDKLVAALKETAKHSAEK